MAVFKHFIVFLIFLTFQDSAKSVEENPYSFYLFENSEGCVKTFNAELKALRKLQEYQKLLKEHKTKVKSIIDNWHVSKSLLNPIDSYKRLAQNFYSSRMFLSEDLKKIQDFDIKWDILQTQNNTDFLLLTEALSVRITTVWI